jgi:hypothetical protein
MSAAPEVIEGAWEEVSRQSGKLNGHRVRVTILPDEEQQLRDTENAAAITYLQERLKKALTDPEEIRQAEAELEELHRNLNRNEYAWRRGPLRDEDHFPGLPPIIDVILAAQTITEGRALGLPSLQVIVATSNVTHLSRMVTADLWTNIKP